MRSLLYWHQFNAFKPSEVSKFEYIPVQVSKFYDLILPISNLFRLWETNIKVLIWKKKCGYRYNVYYYIHGILSLFLCTLPAERIHFVENILVSYIVNFHERTYRWIFSTLEYTFNYNKNPAVNFSALLTRLCLFHCKCLYVLNSEI